MRLLKSRRYNVSAMQFLTIPLLGTALILFCEFGGSPDPVLYSTPNAKNGCFCASGRNSTNPSSKGFFSSLTPYDGSKLRLLKSRETRTLPSRGNPSGQYGADIAISFRRHFFEGSYLSPLRTGRIPLAFLGNLELGKGESYIGGKSKLTCPRKNTRRSKQTE